MSLAKKSLGNVLIVKMSAIGDVIHALPVSYAIKESFPETKLTWVVEKAAYDLLVNNPYIDEFILFEKAKFRSLSGFMKHFSPLAKRLRDGKFDIALDLQGLAKSAAIAYLSKAPQKFGFCNMREGSQWISQPICGPNQNGSIVERYLDVARAIGCKVQEVRLPIVPSDAEILSAQQTAIRAGLALEEPYVILIPGANWLNKRWPTHAFAALADHLQESGQTPVVVGGPGDKQLFAEISSYAKTAPIDLTGQTTLKELAYLISQSQAVVGGDTGPLHLAAGLKKPVVALMGPTDANRNGPYGQKEHAIEVTYDCAGCWQRKCPKNWDCLANISEEQVFSILVKLLRRG